MASVVWGALAQAPAVLAGGASAAVVEHPEPEMQVIPAGPFTMGMADAEAERKNVAAACIEQLGEQFADLCQAEPLEGRRVLLFSYAIDRHEVTVAEYRECVDAGACDVAALIAGDSRYVRSEWPMVNVTWRDASQYCAWRGARLPTEAEWEKAARGTDGRRFPWGDHVRSDGSNHGKVEARSMMMTHGLVGGSFGRPLLQFVADPSAGGHYALPPGTLRWSASPYGVYDMAGNVSEWVQDYYRAEGYGDLPAINPARVTAEGGVTARVVRGGSWRTPRLYGRTYYRESADPESRSAERGVRCARDVGARASRDPSRP